MAMVEQAPQSTQGPRQLQSQGEGEMPRGPVIRQDHPATRLGSSKAGCFPGSQGLADLLRAAPLLFG
jgi:hypothetical protein